MWNSFNIKIIISWSFQNWRVTVQIHSLCSLLPLRGPRYFYPSRRHRIGTDFCTKLWLHSAAHQCAEEIGRVGPTPGLFPFTLSFTLGCRKMGKTLAIEIKQIIPILCEIQIKLFSAAAAASSTPSDVISNLGLQTTALLCSQPEVSAQTAYSCLSSAQPCNFWSWGRSGAMSAASSFRSPVVTRPIHEEGLLHGARLQALLQIPLRMEPGRGSGCCSCPLQSNQEAQTVKQKLHTTAKKEIKGDSLHASSLKLYAAILVKHSGLLSKIYPSSYLHG